MRFQTKNKKIHWEDTGIIKLHNFPAGPGTFSYITRTYREYNKDEFGWREVNGEPIYFYDMTFEQQSLATIMGTAQNVLMSTCKRENFLTPLNEE
jgi:hypothetical protein